MESQATVLTNAVVLPMTRHGERAEAVAFADGVVRRVGSDQQAREAAGPDAKIVDLGGRAVAPGFIDAHHHLLGAVFSASVADCSPAVARSIADVQSAVREAAERLPSAAWVRADGYDELELREGRHPTRRELDEACPDRPVLVMHYSYHEAVASSRGLREAGIDRDTEDPPAGIIARDRSGEPTGHLVETACGRASLLADRAFFDAARPRIVERLREHQRALFACGITRVCDPTVPRYLDAFYREARASGDLRIPVTMLPSSSEGHLLPPWDRLDDPPTGEGPEQLRVGPLKLFLDGGTRCGLRMTLGQGLAAAGQMLRIAARSRSLAVLRSTGDVGLRLGRDLRLRMGVRFLSDEDARKLVADACDRGFSVALHAIGNAAVDQALDAIGRSRRKHPDVPPPRIEHASVLTEDLARRAADLGVHVVTQPYFLELPVFEGMPRPPGFLYMGLRTLLDAGVGVAGSSDAPVTGFDPLDGIRAAVRRRSRSGRPFQPEQAVSPEEAVAAYTRGSATAAGCLDVAGTLEPGKRADLVVLSHDPTADSDLDRVRVQRTYLAGEPVHTTDP